MLPCRNTAHCPIRQATKRWMKHRHRQPVRAGSFCKIRLDVQFVGWYGGMQPIRPGPQKEAKRRTVLVGRLGGPVASKFGVDMYCDK
jgi:hypothetical protein